MSTAPSGTFPPAVPRIFLSGPDDKLQPTWAPMSTSRDPLTVQQETPPMQFYDALPRYPLYEPYLEGIFREMLRPFSGNHQISSTEPRISYAISPTTSESNYNCISPSPILTSNFGHEDFATQREFDPQSSPSIPVIPNTLSAPSTSGVFGREPVSTQPQNIYIHNNFIPRATTTATSTQRFPCYLRPPSSPIYTPREHSESPCGLGWKHHDIHGNEYTAVQSSIDVPGGRTSSGTFPLCAPPSPSTSYCDSELLSPVPPVALCQQQSPSLSDFDTTDVIPLRAEPFSGKVLKSYSAPVSGPGYLSLPMADTVSEDGCSDFLGRDDILSGRYSSASPLPPQSPCSFSRKLSVVRVNVGTKAMKEANKKRRKYVSGSSFRCKICQDTLASKFSLDRHMDTHWGRRYRCTEPGCGVDFGNTSDRQRHIKRQHSKSCPSEMSDTHNT